MDQVMHSEPVAVRLVSIGELRDLIWSDNAKLHDLDGIKDSIRRFGFSDPPKFDGKLGALVYGNGRAEALLAMHDDGEGPPSGVQVKDGVWHVPVIFGVDQPSAEDAQRFAIEHNNLTLGEELRGEWARLWGPDVHEIIRGWGDLVENAAMTDSPANDQFSFDSGESVTVVRNCKIFLVSDGIPELPRDSADSVAFIFSDWHMHTIERRSWMLFESVHFIGADESTKKSLSKSGAVEDELLHYSDGCSSSDHFLTRAVRVSDWSLGRSCPLVQGVSMGDCLVSLAMCERDCRDDDQFPATVFGAQDVEAIFELSRFMRRVYVIDTSPIRINRLIRRLKGDE